MKVPLAEELLEPPPAHDAEHIRDLRTGLGFSQPYFSKILNVSPKTVQSWEQGTRTPNGAAARLLQLIEHPQLLDALRHQQETGKDWIPFAHPLGFIRLILLVDFDPIKMFGEPGAMDEYDRYAIKVYDLFQSGAGPAEIAAYLSGFQSASNSKEFEPERLLLIAEKIWLTCHRSFARGEDSQ